MSDTVTAIFVLGLLGTFIIDRLFWIRERIVTRKDQSDILIKSIEALGRQWDRDREEYKARISQMFEQNVVLRAQLQDALSAMAGRTPVRPAAAPAGDPEPDHGMLIDPKNLD